MPDTAAPSSWGEALNQYVKEKRHTAPLPESAGPVSRRKYRDPNFNLQEAQRQFDPVRGRWSDPETEKRALRGEEDAKIRAVNRGRRTTLKYDTPYDVVTNQEKRGMSLGEPDREAVIRQLAANEFKAANRSYNIISNQDFADHHWTPAHLRPKKIQRASGASSLASQVESRQYDVVSNRYWSNHEERIQKEVQDQLTQAAKKFYANNTLDPVRGVYVDPEREEQDQRRLRAEREARLKGHSNRLPQWMRQNQGAQYDITAPARVRDEALLKADEERARRKLAGKQLKYKTEEAIHQQMEKDAKKAFETALTKVSYTRFLQSVERGYNIIDNTPLQGRQALRKIYEPPTVHEQCAWTKLTGQAVQHKDGFFAPDPAQIPLSHGLPAPARGTSTPTESSAAPQSLSAGPRGPRRQWQRPQSGAALPATRPSAIASQRPLGPRSAGQQPAYLRRVKIKDSIRW